MQGIRKPFIADPTKADVYGKALKFMNDMYEIADQLPSIEKWNMSDQIRRASSSICSNYVEGRSSIYYATDYSRIDISIGSANECRAFLDMALMRGYIKEEQRNQLNSNAEHIIRMLIGLMKHIEKKVAEVQGKKV